MPHLPSARRAVLGAVLSLAALAAAACEPAPTHPDPEPPLVGNCTATKPGLVCNQFTHNGLTRKIFTHLSPQPSPLAGRPVVLFFHGDGGSGDATLASVYAQTDPAGAVVVQMHGVAGTWSFFMDGSHVDDVAFTKSVVDQLGTTLLNGIHIDRSRVYGIGSSRGAFMVNTLAVDARTADTFAAIAPIAGNFYCETGDLTCQVRVDAGGMGTSAAVISVNGDADGAVPPPATVPTPATSSISWPWPIGRNAYDNGCSATFTHRAELTPSMSGLPTHLYMPSGSCGTLLAMVLVKGGGHGVAGWQPAVWSFLASQSR